MLRSIGHFGLFCGRVAVAAVTPPVEVHAIAVQTWTITARCFLPVVAVVFPVGMVMALQGLAVFDLFGAQRMLSSLVGVAVFRELSPVLASVLVAAQGGSSFAAELGAMRIDEELDATAVMAVDPVRVHVVPRVVAILIATPVLNLLGSMAGIAGSYTTAVYLKGETAGTFWANLWAFTAIMDIWGGLIKTLVFGAIIGLVACYHGFYATGGAAGVGVAVNNTVVRAAVGFIVVNYFLTSALFGFSA